MSSGRDFTEATFHVIDYIILVFMMVVSMAIGMYYAMKGRKETSAKEYFTASGTIGVLPATFSLLASVLCSIWYIGYPAEIYNFGFHFIFDVPLLPTALALVAYGFLPVFYDLGVTSANEYLEKRFNKCIRLYGSILYMLNSALYVALVMFIPALSVSQVTGINLWLSIVVMCAIGTIYTAVGGIRAVMWTDVFQMLIIYTSMIAVIIKGTIDIGGISVIFNRALKGNRIALAPISFDPRYRYNLLGMVAICQFYWLGLYGTYQTQVQRYLSCPSKKMAQRALWWNLIAFWIVEFIIVYIGLLLYANYADCDPQLSNQIHSTDEILTYYVMKSFELIPGLSGLFISGVFSGALSTISSCLNSMAAVTMEDFILAIPKFKHMKDETRTNISKLLAVAYGILTIALMTIVEKLNSVITFWGYNNGVVMGCNMGLFVLGLFCPWVNSKGAGIGVTVSGVFGFIIALGGQLTGVEFQHEPLSTEACSALGINISSELNNNHSIFFENSFTNNERLFAIVEDGGGIKEIFAISPFFIQPFTFMSTVLIGALTSLLFRSEDKVDIKLLSPLIRRWIKPYSKLSQKVDSMEVNGKELELVLLEPEVELTKGNLEFFSQNKFMLSKIEKVIEKSNNINENKVLIQ